jgi:catechol 2,3-dioxygenase-like lactoylglutathione lyase family enzyme
MSNQNPRSGEMRLEVVVLPVSDADRTKRFYEGLGWRLDADFTVGDQFRVVQMTPPGSQCSIHFGKGLTQAAPGSLNLYLVVFDIDAARADLIGRGVEVSPLFHLPERRGAREPGRDPENRSYRTYAALEDPDGNSWLLQEIRERLPGRTWPESNVVELTELLREAERRHGEFEKAAPKHHWSDWYAAYIAARGQGRSTDEANREASLHIKAQGEHT